ncbi:MAG: hypothetical protein JNK82_29150, partial [Myxococcaceae bacterium]|nr:hypothetical protein [Myxococcaceae bacterium]
MLMTWRAPLVLFVVGCSSAPAERDGGAGGGAVATQAVGGALTGLDPALGTVRLSLGLEPLTLTQNGPFTFSSKLAAGSTYLVRIDGQPVHQRCTVDAGSGTITAGRDVTDVAVDCRLAEYTLGGVVSGAPHVTLIEATSAQTLDAGPGAFRFPRGLPYGSTYAVTAQPPAGTECSVDAGTGTVEGDVGIFVACAQQTFPLQGTITGLDAGGLVLAEATTAQQLAVDAGATGFTFGQPVPYGANVAVNVAEQPAG